MCPTNDFIPFCPTDTGTNLLSEADYVAAADRVSGNKPGVASSKLNNRALRQANAIASQVAEYVSRTAGVNVLDDANTDKLLAQITGALTAYPPVFTKFTSGTGTFNLTFIFQIASGSATAGAVYTHNSATFTVVSTVAAGVLIRMTGTGAPLVSGTLTKTSGTGDSTLSFFAVRQPVYIEVKAVGAGGGGSGSSNSSGGGAGADGGDTTFGSSLISAGGGKGGQSPGAGGDGGSASLGSGPVGLAIPGSGGTSGATSISGFSAASGSGGCSALGGAGRNGQIGAGVGVDASPNSGSGGGGAGGINDPSGSYGGAGGGAGGFVDASIFTPAASYAYSIGVGGAGGSAGASGAAGGSGADGVIEVLEHYQ